MLKKGAGSFGVYEEERGCVVTELIIRLKP